MSSGITLPSGKTNDSKVDLGVIVREIDEIIVINDEAHHIHDSRLAWFKSIEDIHNRLKQKGHFLSLQIDVTATPKHNNGGIFVQTVCDYPLVEAITQNVVKRPVLPDLASMAKLTEVKSCRYTEKYADYIALGVEEWRKVYAEHEKPGKKAVLFVMTDDTRNCDDVAEYLEKNFPEFKDAVLVIHTNNNGEVSEADTKKGKEELKILREASNRIDSWESPYKVIVSVLMLKEGWDVRNVTTIVGLRAYAAKSNILPEQTLGRGIRRMYPGEDAHEYLSVIGTEAFMDFVESIKCDGVEVERKPMGRGAAPMAHIFFEVDDKNDRKDVDKLDIDDLNTLRNLSELSATRAIVETFKKNINELTVQYQGIAEIRDYIKLRQTRPFVVREQGFLVPQKSLFNKIIGDSHLELLFASFLEKCADVISYTKNYLAVHFTIDYVNKDGNVSHYYPDFIVKAGAKDLFIVETKGLEEPDVPLKMARLKKWCEDVNAFQKKLHFDFVFVDEEDFNKYKPDSFSSLASNFRKYKDDLSCLAS